VIFQDFLAIFLVNIFPNHSPRFSLKNSWNFPGISEKQSKIDPEFHPKKSIVLPFEMSL
jgi:hypothetical protein